MHATRSTTRWMLALGAVLLVLAGCAGGSRSIDEGAAAPDTATTAAPAPTTTLPITTSTSVATTLATTLATTTTVTDPNASSAYFIGNSLTDDTLGALVDDVRSFFVMAQDAGFTIDPLAWNLECGASLLSIVSTTGENCPNPVDGIGYLEEALPGHDWDFLMVQPYPGRGSTLGTDIEIIEGLAKMVSPETTVLIFTGWPRYHEFTEVWTADETIDDESPTSFSRVYMTTLTERLGEILEQEVRLVPSAEVLFRLEQRLESGDIPGLEARSDLYVDTAHLGPMGQWLSAVTTASVMTGEDPASFAKPDSPWYGDGNGFSEEFVAAVNEVISEVLSE